LGIWALKKLLALIAFSVLLLIPLGAQNVFAAVFIDSFSVAAQDNNPRDVAFSADGLTMFVLGSEGDDVNEYACGTAFDVSTCAFTVKAGNPFSVNAQDTNPRGLAFSADGLTMFVVGSVGDNVYEYACGTAFDVSTCAFTVKAGNPLSVNTQESVPTAVAFSADGLKMFVIGTTGDDVNEYACGTAFDVSTCAFTVKAGNPFSVNAQETAPTGIAFSTDGLKLFVVGAVGDEVNEYACGTAFDVSTCAFTVKAGNPFSVAAQEANPTGLAFSTDGLKLFVVGSFSFNVNEYALGTAFDISSVPSQAVGGEFIPLDSTMVLAAGIQSVAAWMIPVIVSAIGIGIVIARKF